MTPSTFLRLAIEPALSLLPPAMSSDSARATVLAICLQESGLRHRRQIGGPARGFAQFERAGLLGVLSHSASQPPAHALLMALEYPPERWNADYLHAAVEHNDVLCAGLARCLLWTLPRPLAPRTDPGEGWRQYLDAWRPGRPHEATWPRWWDRAWGAVEETLP